jgi:hypothetical protein
MEKKRTELDLAVQRRRLKAGKVTGPSAAREYNHHIVADRIGRLIVFVTALV